MALKREYFSAFLNQWFLILTPCDRLRLNSTPRDAFGCLPLMAPIQEALLQEANDTPDALRASGLCLLEEKYTPGTWTSTTLDPQEIAGQLWVEATHEP